MSLSNGPSADQIVMDTAELIELHNQEIRIKTRIKDLSFRHEAMGGAKKALDQQYKYAIRDRAEVRSELDAHLAYSDANSLITWSEEGQGMMFAEGAGRHLRSSAEERRDCAVAYAAGYKAAQKNATRDDCPYDSGTPEADQWCHGVEDYFEDMPSAQHPILGDDEAVEQMQTEAEAPVEKRKRGRPRKSPIITEGTETAGSA